MKVRDVMTTKVQSVTPQTDLVTAARYMRDLNVGALPVVDNDQLLGIITDRDIVIRVVAEGKNPQNEQVQTYHTPSPSTISPDDDLRDATDLMGRQQIRRLPVVENGTLVGFLSLGDVAVEGRDKVSGEALEQISYPAEPHISS